MNTLSPLMELKGQLLAFYTDRTTFIDFSIVEDVSPSALEPLFEVLMVMFDHSVYQQFSTSSVFATAAGQHFEILLRTMAMCAMQHEDKNLLHACIQRSNPEQVMLWMEEAATIPGNFVWLTQQLPNEWNMGQLFRRHIVELLANHKKLDQALVLIDQETEHRDMMVRYALMNAKLQDIDQCVPHTNLHHEVEEEITRWKNTPQLSQHLGRLPRVLAWLEKWRIAEAVTPATSPTPSKKM